MRVPRPSARLLAPLLGLVLGGAARAAVPPPAFSLPVEAPGLEAPVTVRVVLPPSYETAPERRFPVLYFLHDGNGDEAVLERRGIAAGLLADMREGRLPEMLIVSPDGRGTWFNDSWDGKVPYAGFLDRVLVPWTDGRFRTVASREGRVAAGISMGGYGVLRWGLANPGLFTAVAGLSAAAQQMTWRGARSLPFFLRPKLDAVFGADPVRNVYASRDLYQGILDHPERSRGAPTVLLRCGTADRYRLDVVAGFFSKYLAAAGIESEVVLEPGGHDWDYWKRSLPAAVADLARRLR